MKKTVMSIKTFITACMFLCATASLAANGIWNGTVDALWTNSANWSASPYPSGVDTASFTNAGNSQTTLDLDGLSSIRNITFDTPSVASYTIGTSTIQTLVLGGTGVITLTDTAATSQVFQAGLQLGGDRATGSYTINNLNTNQTLTFNNVFGGLTGGTAGAKTLSISGVGNTTILGSLANGGATSLTPTLSGAGTVTLKGTNAYTGNTILNRGTLTLGSDAALPTGNIVSMSGLGTLDLGGYGATINNISASTVTNTITDNSSGPGTNTLSITAHASTINAVIKDGPSKAVAIALANANAAFPSFTNSAANTFSGGLTLKNTGNGTRIRISNPVITVGTPGNITSSTFGTGPINIGEAATDKAGILFDTVGTNTIVNAIVVNSSRGTDALYALRTDTASNVISGTVTANADVTTGGAGTLTLSNVISGTGGVTMVSGGSLILSGVNNYTGITTITNGTMILKGNSALPVNSPVSLLQNGTLKILQDGAGNNGTIALNNNNITLSSPATATIDVGNNGSANTGNTVAFGALNNGTPLNTFNGTINFTGANGYLQSFSTLRLTGLAGGSTTLKPTTTSVTILGNVENQESGTVVAHWDTLALDGTSVGNTILGCIADATGYISVNNGDTRVTKSSTSTWTLFGTNTYHGPTTVSAGTLIIGGAGKLGGGVYTGTIAANGGLFNYASSEAQIMSGVVSGGGTISKTGSGSLTLTAVNTFSGTITNNNGLLIGVTSGTCSNSSIVVQSIGSGVTASLGVRYTAANAQWACSTLTTLAALSSGNAPALAFAFESSPSTTVAPLFIRNNLTLDASTTISVDPVNLVAGDYPLLVYGGAYSGPVPTTITPTIGNGLTGTLAWGTGSPYSAQTLVLTVSGTATSTDTLRWSGVAGTGTWDINNIVNTNWSDTATVPSYYKELLLGNPVQFEDSQITADQTVTLDSLVYPMSVIASNSLYRYTVSGNGAINGATGLTKLGTNTFTLATANTYFGPTIVNEGVLALSGLGTLGLESPLTLSGGVVDLGGLSASVGPVSITNAPASGNTIQNGNLQAASYLANLDSGTATVSANLSSAGTLTKAGAGSLVLSGTNSFVGTTVTKGFLTLSAPGSLLSGATVTVGSATPGTLTIDGGTLNCGGNHLQTGNAAGHLGAIYMNSGLVTNIQQLLVGGGANTANYGFLKISGGTWSQPVTGTSRYRIGQYGSIGLFYQTNGTFNGAAGGSQAFDIANAAGANTGVVYLAGSALINHNAALVVGGTTAGSLGVLTVSDTATAIFNGSITIGGVAGIQGFANLNGGTLQVNSVTLNAAGLLTFNGGTLKAGAANTAFNAGAGRALVFTNGVTVDTGTNRMTVAQNLLAPTGSGIETIPVLTSGSGYIGAPFVGINGDGGGATAIANMTDDGMGNGTYKIQSLTLTSPGTNYTLVTSVTLAGGGGSGATFDTAGATFVANISGGLTKQGMGTLTLSGINMYGGDTVINNGKLLGATGTSCSNSAVSVAATDGNSAVFGVSITDNTKQWTCASLTVTNNGISSDLEFDYGTIVPSLTLAPLNVIGGVAFDTLPTVTVKFGINSIGAPGTKYPLMVWDSTTGTTPTAVTVISLRAITGHLEVVGKTLTLVIDTNEPIQWALSTAGIWDTLATNWVDGADAQTTYRQTVTPGDQVIFNDNAHITAHTTVTLNSTVSPANVTVSNMVYNYAITGTGAIAGTTPVTKLGAGTLTLDTPNTYTGGTILSAGQLNINKATAIGATASRFTINGGMIDNTSAADLTLSANNPQSWNGDFTYIGSRSLNLGTGAVTPNNNRQITVSSNTLTVAGVISGAYGFTKAGNGTLTLTANNTYTGNVIVTGGNLNANGSTSLGALTSNRTITVNSGGTLSLNINNVTTGFPGNTTPALTVNGGTLYVTRYNASGMAAYNNGLTLQNGGTVLVNIPNGTDNNYYALQLGDLVTVSGTSGSVITNGVGTNSRLDLYTNTTFNVAATGGAGADLSVYAPLVNLAPNQTIPSGLIKDGAGTMALYAANTYTGPTFIKNGKLVGVTGGSINSVVTNNAATGNSTLGVLITDNIKQWSCNGLTFTGASPILDFDFGTYIFASTNLAPLKVNGVVAFTTTPTVTVSGGSISGGPGTSYPLMTWTTVSGTEPTAVTVTVPRGAITAHLEKIGSTLYLVIDTNSGTLNWATSPTGLWDTALANWKLFNGTSATYDDDPVPGDQVLFSDTFVTENTTVTLDSAVTPTSVSANNAAYNYILTGSGSITGNTSLNKSGSGIFTLGTANTYSGGTYLSGGTLALGNSSAVPVGSTLYMSGTGTLDLNGTGATLGNIPTSTTLNTITDNSLGAGTNVLSILNQPALTISALIKDGADKSVAVNLANSNAGAPTPFLLTAASTYSGGLTLKHSAGGGTRLVINGAVTTVGSAGNITSSPFGRGPIIIGEAVTDKAGLYITTATTIANELIVNTPLGTDQPYTIRVDVNTMNLSGRVTANADLTMGCQTGTGSVTLTNVISGARGVTMPAGGGTLTATLSGPNTYLGKTVVNKGTLSFNSIKNVGGGASALGAPATVADGTIDLNADLKFNGPATSSDRILNLTGTNGRLYNDGTGLLTLTQGITGNNQNFVVRGSGSITISGLIATGSGSLSRTDAGTLTLSNPLNSFSGTLIVMDGVISSDTIANSGLPCGLGQGTTIQLGQNSGTVGTLRFTGAGGGSCNRAISLWGTTATAGGIIENTVAGQTLTFSGNVSRGGTGTVARLQFSGAGNGALSGNIISNALLVQKSGAGTWTFTGNNTYTGATTVAGGTLVLSGLNGAITNSLAYAINSGAMLVLENTSAANNTNRLRDASAITLDNGTLCFTNNGGATASYRENAGALTVINSGTIVSAQAATGMTNILSLGALTRSGSATLNFVAPGLGASDRNRIFIAGQPNGLIGLWATINTTNYAAYDSSLGVIVAGTGESFTNILAKGPSIIPDDPALNAWINEEGTEGGITLAAAYTNRIKTLVQNTDWLATVAMTNKTLMVNEVLVSTGNARTLTLGTAVGEGAVAPLSAGGELLLTADATNSLLTINAAISNNTSASTVTKRGLGTVVLAGTNIFTGNLNVNSGTLLVSGSNALAGAVVNIGGVSGDAIVKMPAGSSLVGTGNTSIGSIINGNGAFYLNGGQVLRTNSDNERNFAFGSATGGYGYFSMSDGYLSSQRIALGINGNVGTALARITGGIATFNSWVLIGRAGGIGVMTIDGGSVIQTGTANSLMLNYDGGRGELNMTGGLFDNAGKPLIVRQTAGSGSTGIVNVCSGTLIVNSFVNRSTAYLNFNGGLLKAGAASTTFLPSNMTGVYVNGPFGANAGGARIDSDGRDITFAAPLIAPPGSGVTAISLSTQGSGYIGEPYVSITGDGVGATAVANMADDGTGNGTYKVDSVTVTTPGINYTTATVSFLKGGATAVAPTVDAVTLATTAPAGLTKLGLGTLTLSGTNTYAGVTTISNGTLRLGIANALPTNSVVNVNGGIYDLGGFTVTNGQVNVTSGSIRNGTIGNPAITVDDTATMTTRIGSSGLTKNGNGTLVLNGPADNFSTGPLVVNTGTLRFSFGPLNEGQGLSYWLDANNASKLTLANTNVTAWADSSTNGVNFAQGTSANQPVYVSNVINGLPALRFSGNQKMVASKTVNAQTVFIVNTSRSTVNLDGIWGATPDTGIRVGNATSWQYPGNGGDFATAGGQMFINGIAGNTFAASTPHLLTAISATQRTGWSTMIGNYYTGRWFKGDIGELLVYNSALGAVDRQSVEAYLLTKWFGVPSITNLNVSLADDTYLDLGGGSVTLANLAGSGTVSNGTLSVTGDLSPASTNKGTLTVKANTTFSGKLIANVATDGSCDILDVQGNLTLSSPTLEIADLAGLSTIRVYTLVTCSGTITGSFTSTNIPDTRWALRYTADNKVQLFYKGGTMVRIM